MAVDMFLKLGDIKGESQAVGHTDEIEVLSWSWGCSQTGTTHSGTGGGTGTASVQDLTISKYVDKSSPTIVQSCCQGVHMPEAVLTLRKAGGNDPVEYLKITLKEVLISRHSVGSGGGDQIAENVTLNFAQFCVEYQPQDNNGAKKGGVVTGKWNIPKNTANCDSGPGASPSASSSSSSRSSSSPRP
ncbi:Hcp1 family type VI secretion system effector [Caballeronia calidae]|uniref:Hcp1 family type VI secretion system effector n=1 Tax=Caballeronia calidae TaxID=1777139 RepID=A0A158EJW9_9BURK|nr:type VI secretion system tube protein Hcp [Caballeronia calidae]SAL06706.1 Hcp1 family type VI secretion system effector [Caballeronia calidae]